MKTTSHRLSRRQFVKSSALLGGFTFLSPYLALGQQASRGVAPSERVNVALIGIGNRGNLVRNLFLETGLCNFVALCDIDPEGVHTLPARYQHGLSDTPPEVEEGEAVPEVLPLKARFFTDFRRMFDEMADEIDAVIIATPDHSHFAAAMLAMSLGKHVYVEKPLAHTFGQCARLMDLADRSGVVTQMGNQGHSGANYFQFKAWSEAGVIKDVSRITAYMTFPRRWHGWGQDTTGYPREPLPAGVEWDQWLDAVASTRPYSARLHPEEWRSWFEFGSGCFGDWGPHILDTSHRFLKLGLPKKITALKREGPNDFVHPQASTIQFDFPAREAMPPCTVTWYDGVENMPLLEAAYSELEDGSQATEPMPLSGAGKIIYGKDLVFKGGSHSSALQIVPKERFLDLRRSLPRFPQKNSDHYENFLLACKGEERARCPFRIGGELTQVFSLGILAQQLGGEIEFDRETKQITNNPIAQALLDPAPRRGWEEFYAL